MFSDHHTRPYRNRFSCLLYIFPHHVLWNTFSRVRAFITILFLTACCPDVLPEAVSLHTHKQASLPITISSAEGSTLDIFTFQDDRLRRLDSYQRVEEFKGQTAYAESTTGQKIFFFCLSNRREIFKWTDMNSYASLGKVRIDLENETRECLTRTGECRASANESGKKVILKPLVAAVRIDRISCDFSGTPYAGQPITNVRAYLTNVNATYGLTGSDSDSPERIINQGMLNRNDLKAFTETDLVFSELTENLSTTTVHPDFCFLCYPNRGDGNSIGTPHTRLVIEGKIDGLTYYWPISVKDIERGCCYTFDILLRRKGTSDPDTPIEPKDCKIQFDIKPWIEKEEYGVRF